MKDQSIRVIEHTAVVHCALSYIKGRSFASIHITTPSCQCLVTSPLKAWSRPPRATPVSRGAPPLLISTPASRPALTITSPPLRRVPLILPWCAVCWTSTSCSIPFAALPLLASAEERERHEAELAHINARVQRFVDRFTATIQSSLPATSEPASVLSPSSFPRSSSHPSPPSLDGILPPPPSRKRREPAVASRSSAEASPSSSACGPHSVVGDGGMSSEEDEVARDGLGRSIVRRRSKLPLRSVLLLRQWFAAHLCHPYPTEAERRELAAAANLKPRQVQNCQPRPRTAHASRTSPSLSPAARGSRGLTVPRLSCPRRADQHEEAILGSVGSEALGRLVHCVGPVGWPFHGPRRGADGRLCDSDRLRRLQPGGLLRRAA